MGALPWMLCAALLLWGATATVGTGGMHDPAPACEPAPRDELVARTVSMIDRGPTVDVTVVLGLVASADVPLARVRASRGEGASPDRAPVAPDEVLSLRRDGARRLRYVLALEKGELHHLYFDVRSEDGVGAPYEARAYLRVNLDPDLEPEDLGDLLQYRLGPKRGVGR